MTFEAGKEMDRKCVLDWLNAVYRSPSVVFYTYSDKQLMELAHDALVLLKEQEAVEPIEVFRKDTNCHEYRCKRCGNKVGTILGGKHPILPGVKLSIEHFCDVCGQAVKWDE